MKKINIFFLKLLIPLSKIGVTTILLILYVVCVLGHVIVMPFAPLIIKYLRWRDKRCS
jgi:hypothetical protein